MNVALSALRLPSLEKANHLIIDSTGLKVFGEKEWLETKHGKQYQRKVWRKLHIGIEKQGIIVAKEMTNHLSDDRACALSLLNQAGVQHVDNMLADGGYESHELYHWLAGVDHQTSYSPSKTCQNFFNNQSNLKRPNNRLYQKEGLLGLA